MSDFEVSLNTISPSPSPPSSFEVDARLSEEGACCFCAGPCNPCSQACGPCIRKPMKIIRQYDSRDNFLEELKEAYDRVRAVLGNKPKEYWLEGNKSKYNRGVENLRRSLRYFFEAYEAAVPEDASDNHFFEAYEGAVSETFDPTPVAGEDD